MTREHLRELLRRFEKGELEEGALVEELARLPFRELPQVRHDTHRALRQGAPEVVLGSGKTPEHIVSIARGLESGDGNLLVTRVDLDLAKAVRRQVPEFAYHSDARALVLNREPVVPPGSTLC